MKQLFKYGTAIVAALGLFPSTALAHLISTGFGPVYDGIGHFFLSLEDLLPLLALMLLCGLHGADGGRRLLLLLPPIWLIGAMIGARFFSDIALPPYLASALSLVIGVAVASDVRLSLSNLGNTVALVAVVVGGGNGIALAGYPGSTSMLIGGAAALAVASIVCTALVVKVTTNTTWQRIAVRVGGSWIAGVGLLMLGWQLKA